MIAMETRTGYAQLRSQLERLRQRFPHAQIYLRIDAAGQYAANLESFLRSLTHLSMKISIGEPKRNKDYHSAHSPKSQSDATESHAMKPACRTLSCESRQDFSLAMLTTCFVGKIQYSCLSPFCAATFTSDHSNSRAMRLCVNRSSTCSIRLSNVVPPPRIGCATIS